MTDADGQQEADLPHWSEWEELPTGQEWLERLATKTDLEETPRMLRRVRDHARDRGAITLNDAAKLSRLADLLELQHDRVNELTPKETTDG